MREIVGGCPLDCPDGCSWVVTVDDDGRAVKLRGNPEHPFTQGGLCVKVNPYLDHAARPDRLLHPLRRVGAKGEGRFERVSWDDALGEIAQRFQQVIDEHGGEAIWPYAGTGTVGFLQGTPGAGKRLFHHLGASRHRATICSVAGHVGMGYTSGTAAGMDPEDLVHSGVVLLWGANTLTSNQHLWPFIEDARTKGAQIVVIDPLRTRTARRADRHLAPMPGTDGALALGLMAELIRLGAADEPWLVHHSLGWDEFRDAVVGEWTAARAAAISGVDAAEITALAELIANSGPLGIRASMGMQRHAGGGQALRVVSCLPAITGAFAQRGGGMCYSTSDFYGFDTAALKRPDLQPGPTRALAMTRLGHGLLEVDDPPVKALMIWAANPVVSNPDESRVRAGLARDDLFTVVVDHVHTDTTAYADLVLPGTTQLEHVDLHDSFSHTYVQWNNAAVEPPGECLSHTEIFRRLARAMQLSEPALFATDHELAEAALGGDHPSMAPLDFAELRETGWARLGATTELPFAEGFPTASGRFEFTSERGVADGVGRLPHYVAPMEVELDAADGSLALLAPANHHLLNSTFSTSERHGKAGHPTVELHPDDAERLGLAHGDDAEIRNDRGAFRAEVVVSDLARPGVAATTKGRPARPSGVNATVAERDADMGQGAVYHDNRVWITRVGPAGAASAPGSA